MPTHLVSSASPTASSPIRVLPDRALLEAALNLLSEMLLYVDDRMDEATPCRSTTSTTCAPCSRLPKGSSPMLGLARVCAVACEMLSEVLLDRADRDDLPESWREGCFLRTAGMAISLGGPTGAARAIGAEMTGRVEGAGLEWAGCAACWAAGWG